MYSDLQLVCVVEKYVNRYTPIKGSLVIITIDTANVQTTKLEAEGRHVSYEC